MEGFLARNSLQSMTSRRCSLCLLHLFCRIQVYFTPSLILLDLMMPGLSGWEVITILRAHPVTEGIPVVAVTADVLVSKGALKEAGFCGLVTKPVLPKQLLQAIEQCLEEKARRGDGAIEWVEIRVGL